MNHSVFWKSIKLSLVISYVVPSLVILMVPVVNVAYIWLVTSYILSKLSCWGILYELSPSVERIITSGVSASSSFDELALEAPWCDALKISTCPIVSENSSSSSKSPGNKYEVLPCVNNVTIDLLFADALLSLYNPVSNTSKVISPILKKNQK